MPLELTQHARNMLRQRGIDEAWVERTVQDPEATEQDRIDPALEHCVRRIPECGNRVLRVIADRSVTPNRIVAAFFDRGVKVSS